MQINGLRSKIFPLSTYIQQRCPLAPSIFMVDVDFLHYIHRYVYVSPRLKGILLPNELKISNIQFIDDTKILIHLSEENVEKLITKLYILCKAPCSKISISKLFILG